MDHVTYDATVDDDYWLFSWAEMGLYDDPANINAVRDATGYEKIFYLGYSQGTIQMHYALAHDLDPFIDSLYKVVHLAPCFVCSTNPQAYPLELRATACHAFELGVYNMSGPNWEENKSILCAEWEELCPFITWFDNFQPTSVYSDLYWIMNASVDRFQEYPTDYCTGKYTAPSIDLSTITGLPISFFVGSDDTTCSYAHAMEYIP